jgi:hypothetical protein
VNIWANLKSALKQEVSWGPLDEIQRQKNLMLLSYERLQLAFEGNLIDSPEWAVIPQGLPGRGGGSSIPRDRPECASHFCKTCSLYKLTYINENMLTFLHVYEHTCQCVLLCLSSHDLSGDRQPPTGSNPRG